MGLVFFPLVDRGTNETAACSMSVPGRVPEDTFQLAFPPDAMGNRRALASALNPRSAAAKIHVSPQ